MTKYLKNCRCNICSKASSSEIITDPWDLHRGGFYKDPDPKRYGVVCSECLEHIQEVKTSWDINDELARLEKEVSL